MKTSLIFSCTAAGFAALFVNNGVVLEANSPADADKLLGAATKLGAALGVRLVEHTHEAADDSAPNWAALASTLPALSEQPDTVPVRSWDAYDPEDGVVRNNTHSFEISDARQFDGQARLIVSAQANPEDLLDVLLEVQASPFNPVAHVPVAQVHVDMDDPVVSVFKLDDTLLIRPNTGVSLEHEVVVIDGKPEDVIIVKV